MTTPSASGTERLSSRSLRGYAAVLAVSLWVVAAWTLATPGRLDRNGTLKGIDFGSSWLSGRLVAEGRADLLYDHDAWRAAFPRLFPDAPGLLFLPNYPPQAALFFSPFGRLPFEWGVVAWTAVSLSLYAWSIRALWRCSPALAGGGLTVALAAAGWPAFFLLALNAQNTTIVLACYTLAALAFAAGREWWMGVAFGFCAIKPHFAIVPAVLLLVAGRSRAVAGMAAAVALQAAVVAAVLGPDVFGAYWRASVEVLRDAAPYEPKLWQAHGLKNALDLLLGRGTLSTWLYLGSAAAVVALAVRAWRRELAPRAMRFAVLVVASALLNPHLYGYDLVVLAPALLAASDWSARHAGSAEGRRLAWLTVAVVLVPLAAPVAALTRVQVSVPIVAWFGWELFRLTECRARPSAGP